jgi:general secretion pathway protein F
MSISASRWRFRAADASGVMRDGVIDAPSEGDALDQLRRRALWPVEVVPASGAVAGAVAAPRMSARWESRGSALASAMRALSAMLDGGTPLEAALALVGRDASHPALARELTAVRERVLAGRSLSESFVASGTLFPPLVSAMAAAGEQSGGLGLALSRVADDLEERAELTAQLRGALLYPAVLAVAALIGITLLLTVVVPRFARLLADSGQTLPWSTRVVVGTSTLVGRWWWVLVPAALLGAMLVRQWMSAPSTRRSWHLRRLALPVIGPLEETLGAARVLRTLSLLLPTGVPLLTALEMARLGVGNVVLQERLERALSKLRDGAGLADAFRGALPSLAVQLISAGERGGSLGVLAGRAAQHYDGLVRRRLRGAVALVEPVIIILFGGLIAFVAVAMLQAIYGINARAL